MRGPAQYAGVVCVGVVNCRYPVRRDCKGEGKMVQGGMGDIKRWREKKKGEAVTVKVRVRSKSKIGVRVRGSKGEGKGYGVVRVMVKWLRG